MSTLLNFNHEKESDEGNCSEIFLINHVKDMKFDLVTSPGKK